MATGLERLCKIVIILDHALDHGGLFPTDDNLKKLRHDIQKLIQETKRVRDKHPSNDGLALFPEDEAVRVMTLFYASSLNAPATTTSIFSTRKLTNKGTLSAHGTT